MALGVVALLSATISPLDHRQAIGLVVGVARLPAAAHFDQVSTPVIAVAGDDRTIALGFAEASVAVVSEGLGPPITQRGDPIADGIVGVLRERTRPVAAHPLDPREAAQKIVV